MQTTTPKRIMISRKAGSRLPEGAVNVTRAAKSPWGNPFKITKERGDPTHPLRVVWCGRGGGAERPSPEDWKPIKCVDRQQAQTEAVEAFTKWLEHPEQTDLVEDAKQLKGKDLACKCSQSLPCHADVWLKIANEC